MGLPYEMRSVNAITKIVSDFGTLVEFDYNTAKNFDLRWARVKVCVPDKSVIPPTLLVEITNDEDEMFTRNIVLQPEDNLSLPLLELSHQPGHTYNMSTQSPTGFQDDEPNNLPANSPPPLFEPPIISVDTSPNHITIPWLIPPIEPHAPLSQSNTQLLEDTAVLEYFFCQPPRWYGAGGAGTSAPELSCNAIAQMDKEHNTSNGKDDAANNDQHDEVSEGTSRRKAGKKRKLNKKALASKRRITFSPSRDDLNEGVEHSRNLHDQESLDVAGEGGAPAEEQIDVSAYLANYDNTIQEPLDVTPLKVGAIRRSSARIALRRIQNARRERNLRGCSSASFAEAIVIDDDDDNLFATESA